MKIKGAIIIHAKINDLCEMIHALIIIHAKINDLCENNDSCEN